MATLRIAAGVFVFGMAVLILLTPDSAPPLPTNVFVFVVGLTLLLVGLSLAVRRANEELSGPEVTPVENPAELPLPGSDIDEQLETLAAGPPSPAARKSWVEARNRFRNRLRVLAVGTLADCHGLSEPEARAALDSGAWTENPHAAAFFIGEYQGKILLRTRIREEFAFSKPLVGRQAEHVISELRSIVRDDSESGPGRDEILDAHETGERTSRPVEDGPDGSADHEANRDTTTADDDGSATTDGKELTTGAADDDRSATTRDDGSATDTATDGEQSTTGMDGEQEREQS